MKYSETKDELIVNKKFCLSFDNQNQINDDDFMVKVVQETTPSLIYISFKF
jgi:hypothetical protein